MIPISANSLSRKISLVQQLLSTPSKNYRNSTLTVAESFSLANNSCFFFTSRLFTSLASPGATPSPDRATAEELFPGVTARNPDWSPNGVKICTEVSSANMYNQSEMNKWVLQESTGQKNSASLTYKTTDWSWILADQVCAHMDTKQ